MILCGHELDFGQKKKVGIKVSDGSILDAVLLCGKDAGKTLVVTAGVHGCEYVGIEAVRRLAEELEPEELSGNVVFLPLVNPGGFYAGAKQIVPEDGKNLNRMFPGDARGSLSQQIAHTVEQEVYPYADFLIDLHGGDINESLQPLVFFPTAGEALVNAKALEAAKTLTVPYRVRSTAKNGLYSRAVQKRIPALLIERGAGGRWTEEEVACCQEDVMRIMAYMGIISRGFLPVPQKEIVQAVYEESPKKGFWYPKVRAGQLVKQGSCLGILKSADGKILAEPAAQFDAVVLYYTTALGMQKNDPLVAYGRS